MILKPNIRRDLMKEFREERGQSTGVSKDEPKKRKKTGTTPYEAFLHKYSDIENTVDTLGTRDLVYYFREIAEENGYKYTISNIKKDMAIMRRLRENYTNTEICGMIEFLYESEQDYLDKNRLSPNLLASQWVNTIYADMQLWAEDKYVSKKKETTSKRQRSQREWSSDDTDSVKIGVKL